MLEQILKRDGSLREWDLNKVIVAMAAAIRSEGIDNPTEKAGELTKGIFEEQLNHKIIFQEKVQDIVEHALMKEYPGAAKKFIIYREKRRQQREGRRVFLDVTKTIDDYVGRSDWRVNENANIDFSFQGMVLHLSGSMQAQYMLDQYSEEIRNAHISGYLHIHDLSFLSAYCKNVDVKLWTQEYGDISMGDLAKINPYSFTIKAKDKNGNTIKTPANSCRITQRDVELVEVILENDKVLRVTPNDRFMLRDGSYKEAQNLTIDDEIMDDF